MNGDLSQNARLASRRRSIECRGPERRAPARPRLAPANGVIDGTRVEFIAAAGHRAWRRPSGLRAPGRQGQRAAAGRGGSVRAARAR